MTSLGTEHSTKIESEHEKCRSKVCIICYQKASRKLSDTQIKTIQDYVIDGYNCSHPDFPNAVCTHCSVLLNLKRNDQNVVLRLVTDDYNPNGKLGLRSVDMCLCKICSVARQNGLQDLHSYRKNNKKRGRRPSTKTDPDHVVKICSNCFEKIYRGSGHSAEQCKRASRRTKVANIQDLTSPTTLKRASLRVEKETATHSPWSTKKNS